VSQNRRGRRITDMPVLYLTHIKASEAELRQALHAVNALSARVRAEGRTATAAELNVVLSRIEAAAVHLRALRESVHDEEEHHA